ncbi:NUDIX domain-containing protein [Yimella sp. cx-51]|uniref:NUDIX hydrolase n=1 Tax=Yimella sp. cx-51 TaxID=2770551 RepID=UPI00165E5A8D|nr:NUDIX domain-containing protein [Yimella sp. cx-51]MBC9958399.1 NUDIX hydrolase [Yimella sp. cx-51]MBD2760562.1 NUDIX hydrolase [Yimella sp. cx-573]QTH38196.1 NUDIX hydrolase [Yimella sp. cx-51]
MAEQQGWARIASDVVALTLREGELHVALVKRLASAARGRWALPGGFLHDNESAEQAAYRELAEETGLPAKSVVLEQLATYTAPKRDTDHDYRVISVAWLAFAADLPSTSAGTDAGAAEWVPVEEALRKRLAFDHRTILRDGIERARAKLEYTTMATAFLPEEFTMSELRGVYTAVWGVELDAANFHRKVHSIAGFVEETGYVRMGRGRPATLLRAGETKLLQPPLLR